MDGTDTQSPEITPKLEFPVIGIGASAGGLEAVTSMFHNVDTGTGMAFVLVMHLDPDHESLMAELLSRKTHIQVRQIEDSDPIEVDCLHVIPPGSSLRIEGDCFRLEPFSEQRGLRRPIDAFFKSLAEVQGEKSACVVLSGTGADGSAGLRVVKELGGVVAVQAPDEARYDGMPFSAISTKMVDFTLPASDIVKRLRTFFEGTVGRNPDGKLFDNDVEISEALTEIFRILCQSHGNDFSGYKRSTLVRRLFRRLQVHEIADIHDYIDFLKDNFEEKTALGQDFLINVTSFFRDRENFEIMRKNVIVPLIRNAEPADEVRIWVPGCSSGQEAYSIAMMIDETCEELQRKPLIQIFATDIDEAMIAQARRGHYPISVYSEIPKQYQNAYTIGLDAKFEIVSRIREMVRFSVHNLIQDPPFSKINLISCRNVLIYMGEELQSNLFPLLHFSLARDGHLFLGTSENVARRGELFTAVDQRARVFRKQEVSRRPRIKLPLGGASDEKTFRNATRQMNEERDFPRHQSLDATNASIYEQYAPPFVRVTHDGRIIDSSGDLSLFIMSRPGDNRSLQSLVREGIRDVILPLLSDALESDTRKALKEIKVNSPFGMVKTDIIAHPMKDETVALIFLTSGRLKPIVDEYQVKPVSSDRRITDLQDELQGTRLLLKSKVEEIETANEELKSSNEEMMSMNEELQSANEELTTANEELKNKVDEVTLANSDLDNFLQSAEIAMIVLDKSMRIRHVTNAARRIVPIQRTDQGRSLTEFNIALGGFDIARNIRHVMSTNKSVTTTTSPNEDGRSYFVRITPYFFTDNLADGVSISLVDISTEVRLRHDLYLEAEKFRLAIEAASLGFSELHADSGTISADLTSAEHFRLENVATADVQDLARYIHAEDRNKFLALQNAALKKGEDFNMRVRVVGPDNDLRWLQVHGTSYASFKGDNSVLTLSIDLTDQMKLQQEVMVESSRVKLAMLAGRMGLAELDVESGQVTVDDVLAKQFRLKKSGVLDMDELTANFVAEDIELFNKSIATAVKRGEEYEFDFRIREENGDVRWIRTRGLPYVALDGRMKVVGPTLDITNENTIERREMLIREMSHRVKNLFSVIGGLIQAVPKDHHETQVFADDLISKIVALGRVYDLARTDAQLEGVPLRTLFDTVFGPHVTTQTLNLEGPHVLIGLHHLNTLSLVIHEMTTNASKYGALHYPDGKLDVRWTIDRDGHLRIEWTETADDYVQPDGKEGFGTHLIRSSIKQLKGDFEREDGDKGIKITMTLTISPDI